MPRFFRVWFYVAAVYNLVWGLLAVLFPSVMLGAVGIGDLNYPQMFQVVGMIVGVYAYGYWLLARDPVRYAKFIWIGLIGKVCGPLGFVFYAVRGDLPWSFGWTILPNDLVWWPVFILFAWRYGRD